MAAAGGGGRWGWLTGLIRGAPGSPRGGRAASAEGPDGFAAFDRPGYAKVVWDFRLTPQADGYSMSGTLALA